MSAGERLQPRVIEALFLLPSLLILIGIVAVKEPKALLLVGFSFVLAFFFARVWFFSPPMFITCRTPRAAAREDGESESGVLHVARITLEAGGVVELIMTGEDAAWLMGCCGKGLARDLEGEEGLDALGAEERVKDQFRDLLCVTEVAEVRV